MASLVASVLLAPFHLEVTSDQRHLTPTTHVSFVESKASAVWTEEQLLVADAWREVTRQFVDSTYNGLGDDGWKQKRQEAIRSIADVGPDEKERVYTAIRTMLKALDDPYTRFLTPDQYDSLTAYARGNNLGGIGVQLIVDPRSGKVVVANTVSDGPAGKGGVLPGDVIVAVDSVDVTSATAEVVAAKCRGESGTSVSLAIHRPSAEKKTINLSLTRAKVQVNPVQQSIFYSEKWGKVCLLKIPSFNQETVTQVLAALRGVRGSASLIALDLRGNAGGYLPAGVEMAKLFLPPGAKIISEVDRENRPTLYTADGIASETDIPLYLLVDSRTASASEIVAAALQDNGRATVVSNSERTFGKGRIQNVQSLLDGSGIAVTRARYVTPGGRDINGVGITPDVRSNMCKTDDSASACLAGII